MTETANQFQTQAKQEAPEQMMTIKDLQETLKCSKTFAHQLVSQKDFPKIRVGRRVFIPVSAYNEWVKSYLYKQYDI